MTLAQSVQNEIVLNQIGVSLGGPYGLAGIICTSRLLRLKFFKTVVAMADFPKKGGRYGWNFYKKVEAKYGWIS